MRLQIVEGSGIFSIRVFRQARLGLRRCQPQQFTLRFKQRQQNRSIHPGAAPADKIPRLRSSSLPAQKPARRSGGVVEAR